MQQEKSHLRSTLLVIEVDEVTIYGQVRLVNGHPHNGQTVRFVCLDKGDNRSAELVFDGTLEILIGKHRDIIEKMSLCLLFLFKTYGEINYSATIS